MTRRRFKTSLPSPKYPAGGFRNFMVEAPYYDISQDDIRWWNAVYITRDEAEKVWPRPRASWYAVQLKGDPVR